MFVNHAAENDCVWSFLVAEMKGPGISGCPAPRRLPILICVSIDALPVPKCGWEDDDDPSYNPEELYNDYGGLEDEEDYGNYEEEEEFEEDYEEYEDPEEGDEEDLEEEEDLTEEDEFGDDYEEGEEESEDLDDDFEDDYEEDDEEF
ncbi:MAG TPA: hypothetical protein PK395_07800 [bacterium]|mgnify:CR=1 FL=1|nr:hypothetical protein [bacterium]HQQ00304.1 hypothetical protein [bacterium]